jgi:hypothetical protein
MIDLLAILASCSMLVWMILRAVRRDSREPWFGPTGDKAADRAEIPKAAAPAQCMLLPPPNL